MLKISLSRAGLLDPAKLSAWSQAKQASIRKAIASGMRDEGKNMVDGVRQQMQADFTIRKAGFTKSVRARILERNQNKLPALLIGSKIPWLGLHMRGGTIEGRMLIPLTEEGKRIGRRAFKRVIDTLIRSGNAFFIHRNGKVILMAENLRENQTPLRRFKHAERQRTGTKTIKRSQEIPIAVLVPRVTLKCRFDLTGAVRSRLPALARTLEIKLQNI